MERDRKKVNADKDRQIYYGMLIIGRYELNNININIDRYNVDFFKHI